MTSIRADAPQATTDVERNDNGTPYVLNTGEHKKRFRNSCEAEPEPFTDRAQKGQDGPDQFEQCKSE